MSVYDNPLYFDIAFQYRDIGKECDFIESILELYSKTDNRRILDILCGTGSHMMELLHRGYQVDGFDVSDKMLDYVKNVKKFSKYKTTLWKDNLIDFKVDTEYGLITNMLTSFNYISKNDDVLRHLESVAKSLSYGGIYLLELNHPRDLLSITTSIPNKWVEERDGIEVEIDWDYKNAPLDYIEQVYDLNGKMTVRSNGDEKVLYSKEKIRIFLLQEIKTLISLSGWLNLIKAFGSFNLEQPLDNSASSWRMILLLRKE
jgi:SAM-dependent methyltransferase